MNGWVKSYKLTPKQKARLKYLRRKQRDGLELKRSEEQELRDAEGLDAAAAAPAAQAAPSVPTAGDAPTVDVSEKTWQDHFGSEAGGSEVGPPPVTVDGFAPSPSTSGNDPKGKEGAPSTGSASARTAVPTNDPATEKACEEMADMVCGVFAAHQQRLAEHGEFHWPAQMIEKLFKPAIKGRLMASGVNMVDPATREWCVIGAATGTSALGEIRIRRKLKPKVFGAGEVPLNPNDMPTVPVEKEPDVEPKPEPEPDVPLHEQPTNGLSAFLTRPADDAVSDARPSY